MIAAFFLSPIGRRIAASVGAALLLLAAYAYVDHRGYARGTAEGAIKIAELKAAAVTARDAEIERQDARNSEAKAREASRIAEMQAEAESLEQKIKELEREASQDPDAGRIVLSAPGVRRINQVR
jgi:hypothetical protein